MARARLLPDAQPLPPADRNAEGGPLTRDATTERALRAGVQRRSPTGRAPLPRPLRLQAGRVRAARDLGQRYIARNPVEARLAPGPAAWAWSSYGALRRHRAPSWLAHDRVLRLFGDGGRAAVAYERLILDEDGRDWPSP